MFCPSCGTENPDNGKFCRKCGTNLERLSTALAKDFPESSIIANPQIKPVNLEDVVTVSFVGLAFLIIAVFLMLTGLIGGEYWAFWLLIPAMACLGSGLTRFIQYQKSEAMALPKTKSKSILSSNENEPAQIQNYLKQGNKDEAINLYRLTFSTSLETAKEAIENIERDHSTRNYQLNEFRDYVKPTGKMKKHDREHFSAPPSVIEHTTRHLEQNNDDDTN